MSPVYLQCEQCGFLLQDTSESRDMPDSVCCCGASPLTRIDVTE